MRRSGGASADRGDFGGKLYVQVHGGFLNEVGGPTSESGLDIHKVRCNVELDGEKSSAEFWGKRIANEDKLQQHQVLKTEDRGNRWWFGEMGSTCPRGSRCPEPSECEYCSQKEVLFVVKPGTGAGKTSSSHGTSNNTREKLFTKVLKKHHLWKNLSGHQQDGEADDVTKPVTYQEEIKATFCSEEFVFEVKDFFGRLPIQFTIETVTNASSTNGSEKSERREVGFPTRMFNGGMGTGARAFKGNSASTPNAGVDSKRVETIGQGKAFLSDALSFKSTRMMLGATTASKTNIPSAREDDREVEDTSPEFCERQIIRLVNSKKTEPLGCLIIEMAFIPSKQHQVDETQVPSIHDAVANGQVKYVRTVLESLRRKVQTSMLTKRNPKFDNMNPVEVAAYTGNCRMLETLLDSTSRRDWKEAISSKDHLGRSALHLAVLGNNPKALQMLAMHAYKHELSSSLFDYRNDSVSDLLRFYGYERNRSAFANHGRQSLTGVCDEDGRTPFSLACSLDGSHDAMPLILVLMEFEPDVALPDKYGNTPLMLAAKAGQKDVALLLLNQSEEILPGIAVCRAKPNMPNEQGFRPLHVACEKGDEDLVNALLEAGALPSLRAKDGTTALHLAATNGRTSIVQKLLDWPEQFERQTIGMQMMVEESCIPPKTKHRRNASNTSNASNVSGLTAGAVITSTEDEQAEELEIEQQQEGGESGIAEEEEQQQQQQPNRRKSLKVKEKLIHAKNTIAKPISSLVGHVRSRRSKNQERASPESNDDPLFADLFAELEGDMLGMFSAMDEQGMNDTLDFIQMQQEQERQMQSNNEGEAPAAVGPKPGSIKAKSGYQGVSYEEAIANRKPDVGAIQWSTCMTAAQLARHHGHMEIMKLLEQAEKDEFGTTSTEQELIEATTKCDITIDDDDREEVLDQHGIDNDDAVQDDEEDLDDEYVYEEDD